MRVVQRDALEQQSPFDFVYSWMLQQLCTIFLLQYCVLAARLTCQHDTILFNSFFFFFNHMNDFHN